MTNKKQKSFLIRMLKRVVGFKEACKIAKDLVSWYDFDGTKSLIDIVRLLLDNYYNYRAAFYCPFKENGEVLVLNEYTNKIETAKCLYLGKLRLTVTTYLWEDPWDASDQHMQVTIEDASILLKEWMEESPYALNGEHHAIRAIWEKNGWRKIHTNSYEEAFYPHEYNEGGYTIATGLKNPW